MDSDLHAEHAEHAQQAQHGCGAEFEEASPEALAELDQILTHARAYPADATDDGRAPSQKGHIHADR